MFEIYLPCRVRLLPAVCVAFALAFGSGRAAAQTANPSPTPKSAEVLRLEEEKAQAELRKAIAEANKAELEAQYPKPTSSPLAGTTTVSDGAVIESQMIAYASMARAANKLVGVVGQHVKGGRLAIFNEDEVRLMLSHRTAMSQLEVLRQSYCKLLAPSQTNKETCPESHPRETPAPPESLAFGPALGIARSLLGSFVDLTSFLRTNVEIKGHTFDIDEAPLAAEVFRAARHAGLGSTVVYYPKMFTPDHGPNQTYFILGRLDQVQALRNTAGRLIANLEKNDEDVKKGEAKVEGLGVNIEQHTGALAAAQERLSKVLIKAHCPKVPECEGENAQAFGALLEKYCPNLTGEQRELIFDLASQVGRLKSQLADASTAKQKAEGALAKLREERAKLWEQLFPDLGAGAKVSPAAVADAAGQLKARNEQFDKFIAALVQAGAGGGTNALTSLIRAENIMAALGPQGSGLQGHWLQLKVVKAGGNNRIKTNLLWDIFTGGNRLSHSGGVIVEYILFDGGGRMVAADTITEYTNYIKSDKVRDLPWRKEKCRAELSEIDAVKPLTSEQCKERRKSGGK